MTKKGLPKLIKFQDNILCMSKETSCGKSLNHMIHKLYKNFFCVFFSSVNQVNVLLIVLINSYNKNYF